jgi:hypothetical protein
MDRKRNISIAASLSAAMVVAGTGFAFASGVFGTPTGAAAGSYPAMMARLTPKTVPAAPSTTAAGAAPPRGAHLTPTKHAHGLLAGHFEPAETTAPTTAAPITGPAPTMPEGNDDGHESDDDPTTTTIAPPPVVSSSTTTTVAHSGPSPVTEPEPSDDSTDGAASDD